MERARSPAGQPNHRAIDDRRRIRTFRSFRDGFTDQHSQRPDLHVCVHRPDFRAYAARILGGRQLWPTTTGLMSAEVSLALRCADGHHVVEDDLVVTTQP
jgi:hypothetical protein